MKEIHRLTLEERVGQLFWLGFQGPSPDANARGIIDVVHPGGFLLSQRNIESFDQVCNLTQSLANGNGVPALVGIAQEGGAADRLKQLFAPLPSVRQMAAEGTASLRTLVRIIASELEATGFNTGLSPVLDLHSADSIMRDRTLSSNPGEVTNLGKVFVFELAERGILGCAKHFPGMGSAVMDPHFVLPRIDKPRKSILLDDALPFLNMIDEVPMMMVGHAYYPGLGTGLSDERPMPASLSPRVVGGLLRRKFGFEGVIVTDDLTQGAIHTVGLTSEIFLQAFEAGNDMMMFSQITPLVEHGFQSMVRAARQSPSLRSRIDTSVERILAMKKGIRMNPIRNRAQMRTRLVRQIEKLSLARRERVARQPAG
jgi:beta-N-acetylhexosaminidase